MTPLCILIVAAHVWGACALETTRYNSESFGGEPNIYVNQGKISGIASWGVVDEVVYKGLVLKGWVTDDAASLPRSIGGNRISDNCTSFSIQSDEYIDGYRVSWDEYGYIRRMGFHISNNDTFQCNVSLSVMSSLSNLYDTGWVIVSNHSLIGFIARAGGVIDSIGFQFEKVLSTHTIRSVQQHLHCEIQCVLLQERRLWRPVWIRVQRVL